MLLLFLPLRSKNISLGTVSSNTINQYSPIKVRLSGYRAVVDSGNANRR
jgi:hypothetical protein